VNQAVSSAALGAAGEAAVVVLAMNGDAGAYGELVRRRQIAIRNLLRRLTRDRALADDLAQQTFVQGWKSIGQLKSPAAFGAWLRKLAVNGWGQHVRRMKHEVALDEESHFDAPIPAVAERMDLDAALGRLPLDVRVCIVLAYSEGMSHAEISEAASIALGTVKSHIARGTIRLREFLHAYGDHHVRR
jgi:RNA polymerase sigma-70 factor (ECF subfamily)